MVRFFTCGRISVKKILSNAVKYTKKGYVSFSADYTVSEDKPDHIKLKISVAEYSKEIAKRYGYSPERQEEIYMMGLLHDVGKIGVPDTVINKPGKLTDEEYAMIKSHPAIGAEILTTITEIPKKPGSLPLPMLTTP